MISAELEIKGRGARGNTITKYPIRKVDLLKAGSSTLSKLDLWYDPDSGRLNKDKRGKYLGKFDVDDQLIAFTRNGSYKITGYDLTNRYEPEKTLLVEKFNPNKPISAIYVDGDSKQYMVKRFLVETSTADKEFGFISETIGSRLVVATTSESPEVELEVIKGKEKDKIKEIINLEEVIDVKGWKALGNKLSQYKVTKVNLVEEQEDAGPEEGGDTDLVEAAETEKGSQSSKKKNISKTPANGSKRGSKQASSRTSQSQSLQFNKKQTTQSQKSKSSNKASSTKVQKAKKIKKQSK